MCCLHRHFRILLLSLVRDRRESAVRMIFHVSCARKTLPSRSYRVLIRSWAVVVVTEILAVCSWWQCFLICFIVDGFQMCGKYGFTHSQPRCCMEVGGQLQAPSAVTRTRVRWVGSWVRSWDDLHDLPLRDSNSDRPASGLDTVPTAQRKPFDTQLAQSSVLPILAHRGISHKLLIVPVATFTTSSLSVNAPSECIQHGAVIK